MTGDWRSEEDGTHEALLMRRNREAWIEDDGRVACIVDHDIKKPSMPTIGEEKDAEDEVAIGVFDIGSGCGPGVEPDFSEKLIEALCREEVGEVTKPCCKICSAFSFCRSGGEVVAA